LPGGTPFEPEGELVQIRLQVIGLDASLIRTLPGALFAVMNSRCVSLFAFATTASRARPKPRLPFGARSMAPITST
jgi:hypothetical protein